MEEPTEDSPLSPPIIGEIKEKMPLILYFLGWTVVMGFFTLMGTLMFIEVPAANVGSVNQLFGTLATSFGTVVGYFFGASMGGSLGSKRKDAVIASVVQQKTP